MVQHQVSDASDPAHILNPDAHKISSLDGVRGIAVLSVMLYHFSAMLPSSGPLGIVSSALSFGWSGVDLFFALSGFLITGILLATKRSPNYFYFFYARRLLRIFPLYYLAIFAALAIEAIFPIARIALPANSDRPFYYAMVSNWLPVFTDRAPTNAIGHFWTLALEEQFYIVWPAVVLSFRPRNLKWFALSGVAFSLCLRLTVNFALGLNVGPLYSTLTRCDGLLLGSFCAVIFSERTEYRGLHLHRWSLVPAVAFFTGVVAFPLQKVWFFGIGITLLSMSFSALILLLALSDGEATRLQQFFVNRWLRTLGRYSYGMYVYHVPVLALTSGLIVPHIPTSIRTSPLEAIFLVTSMACATFAIAVVSFRYLEKPILSLKRYARPR